MNTALILTEQVARAFPDTVIQVIAATGLDNRGPWPALEQEIAALEAGLAGGGFAPAGEDDPRISSWFEAYRRFGTNPKKFRPSVNALSRRVARSGRLPRINPAVDAYNLVSVRHGLPAGAFALTRLDGAVEIRFAREGDTFTPLGEPELLEPARPGEVVYATGQRVLTRHWNYRDADHTKVTEDCTGAVFMLERVADVVSEQRVAEAGDALASLLRPHAAEVTSARMDPQRPRATLPPVGDIAAPAR